MRARGAGRRGARGVDIGDCRLQQGGIVLELTDAEIASAAEQPAHLSGDMAVIDTDPHSVSLSLSCHDEKQRLRRARLIRVG